MVIAAAGLAMFSFVAFQGASLLSPRVLWRAYAGAAALYTLGMVEVFSVFISARRAAPRPAAHHHLPPRLYPLLLPFLLYPAAEKSSTATLASNQTFTPETQSLAPAIDVPAKDIPAKILSGPADRPITIDTDNFTENLIAISENAESLRGRRVRIVGFTHIDDTWDDGFFVVGRLLIWCCAADASLIGIPVRDISGLPPEGQWIQAEGQLGILDEFKTATGTLEQVPFIEVESIVPVDKPEMEYAFPPGY
jgi:putative membrane protein